MPAQPPPGPANAGFTLAAAHWPEVEAGARRVLVVPVGSLEQHGAHLPLDTDTRIAAAVAERACAGRDGVGLAPAIAIGASGEHADFPGTLSIGHVALSALLVELGRHASLHWPAMLLVNGHGGNAAAIGDAVRQLRAEGRDCHVWHAELRPSRLAAAGLSLAPDAHAGRVETSVMLALAPGDVRLDAAAAGETRPLAEIMAGLRAHGVRHVSPNGVLGDPAGASAAEGETLLALLTEDLTAALDRLLAPGRPWKELQCCNLPGELRMPLAAAVPVTLTAAGAEGLEDRGPRREDAVPGPGAGADRAGRRPRVHPGVNVLF